MKKFWWRLFTVVVLVFTLSTAYLLIPQTFLSLDNRLRDFLFVLRGPIETTQNVVIIDIDERSLKQEGQWPWSRNRVAKLIQNLSDAQAGIIGLDIVFSEADKSSPLHIASELNCSTKELRDNDAILAKTISQTPTIGGYFFSYEKSSSTVEPLIPAIFITKGGSNTEYLIHPNSLTLNIPIIQDAFYSSGFFNNTPDEGGMIRLVPLLMTYQGSIYPSLALEMVRIYANAQKVIFDNAQNSVEHIKVGDLQIPTDRFSRLMVNYRGPSHTFTYISAADILNKNFSAQDVTGKFVLVGTSAIGLSDLRATPFDILMPGVEVHANVIDNLLKKDFIAFAQEPEQVDLLLIASTTILAIGLFSLVSVWISLPLLIASLYSYYLFFNHLLFKEGIAVNILFPIAALLFGYVSALLINYIISLKQKQMIMNMFAKKVSPRVMQDLIANSSETLLEPHNRIVSVFFSDIRSFTSISEQLGDPKEVINMLNTYMTPMVENITKQEGTIDKFIGDAIMAYWNAPVHVKDHADKALTSALEQIKLLQTLNATLKERFNITIEIGIGIHTGEVTIGEMGSTGRSDYTIIGDNVNLASRLEGLNKLYGSHILISQATKAQLSLTYLQRSVDIVKVKGKQHPVEIFEVLSRERTYNEEEAQGYQEALTFYRNSQLQEALVCFKTLQTRHSSRLYQLYVTRCENALAQGIETFEPITTMLTK